MVSHYTPTNASEHGWATTDGVLVSGRHSDQLEVDGYPFSTGCRLASWLPSVVTDILNTVEIALPDSKLHRTDPIFIILVLGSNACTFQ